MNYSIKWQWTESNSAPFKTQVGIINSHLTPLLEDKVFQESKLSFYITKVFRTQVRLNVHVTAENVRKIQDVVKKHTKHLVINPRTWDAGKKDWSDQENSWDGKPAESSFSSERDRNFFLSYLENITLIGIDLHKSGIVLAIQKASEVSHQIRPIGTNNPQDILDPYFRKLSKTYQEKSDVELKNFWGNCGFEYREGNTEGGHFYYNIVMGIDPRSLSIANTISATNQIISALQN